MRNLIDERARVEVKECELASDDNDDNRVAAAAASSSSSGSERSLPVDEFTDTEAGIDPVYLLLNAFREVTRNVIFRR
jgi:hypothetical protein